MSVLKSIQAAPVPFPRPFEQSDLAQHWGASGPLADLLTGIGGCSPYLRDILIRERDWLDAAIQTDDPLGGLFHTLTPQDLRQGKRRVAGLLGLADVSGAWSLEQITQSLTQFADLAVDLALRDALAPLIERGKIPADHGLFAIAMGKMGAGELNYSSDIDLIVMFDGERHSPDAAAEMRPHLIRATRKAMKMLSDITGEGYVFRTDLRLRPDPSVTPVCLSSTQALSYYESLGRTWERAAFIKARVCAGDHQAGQNFLDQMRPFIWRRHLDFATVQEAHDLRLKIRDKKQDHGPITLPGHDMKLGRGGIREIEFFTQTRQLIAGGRDETLRARDTVGALHALCAAGWVEEPVRDKLIYHYRQHRHIEHRLQMLRDAQTHSLPREGDEMTRVAMFCGRDVQEFTDTTTAALQEVHDLTEGFFAPSTPADTPVETDFDTSLTDQWPAYPALRSDRATELFERLRPGILARLARAQNPNEALLQFDAFLRGLPAGVQVFSLFASNPQLVDLITDIAATAPALSQYLGRNAGVLDGVLSGQFFAPFPDQNSLSQELGQKLAAVQDYETALDHARIWQKEQHFRIGVHLLRTLMSAEQAAQCYADLAAAVLQAILPVVMQEFARKHGTIPATNGVAILGMGSLGAGQLTAQSDLDLMVIYDAPDDEMSDGARALGTRQYYARLTKTLITALSAPLPNGTLYEVDMRLRPSGRKGPVATSLSSFSHYQMHEAWTWEHLALMRARVMTGADDLCAELETLRQKVLAQKGDWMRIAPDVADMRARLARAKPAQSPMDAKNGAGGLQDIELAAQALGLASGVHSQNTCDQVQGGVSKGYITTAQAQDLCNALRLMQTVKSMLALLLPKAGTDEINSGAQTPLLNQLNMADMDELTKTLAECRQKCDRIITDLLNGPHA